MNVAHLLFLFMFECGVVCVLSYALSCVLAFVLL